MNLSLINHSVYFPCSCWFKQSFTIPSPIGTKKVTNVFLCASKWLLFKPKVDCFSTTLHSVVRIPTLLFLIWPSRGSNPVFQTQGGQFFLSIIYKSWKWTVVYMCVTCRGMDLALFCGFSIGFWNFSAVFRLDF